MRKFPMFADIHHYFDWCAIVEKQWRAKVNINPKTTKVNNTLREWHKNNPDGGVINLAQWRLNRERRRQAAVRAASRGRL